MLPKLDGFGLCRRCATIRLLKTLPVILLSARAGEESRVEGLERGADDYLDQAVQRPRAARASASAS